MKEEDMERRMNEKIDTNQRKRILYERRKLKEMSGCK